MNDFADVIPQEYRDKLTSLIQELSEKTSAEIMVATVTSIAPYDEKGYARLLFDSWKPGKKGKDNGVIILLALKERRWRIETGYGVEPILPDGLCGEIGRDYMVPYFKSGRYGEGLYYGASRIAHIIAENAKVELDNLRDVKFDRASRSPSGDMPAVLYIFLPVFFFVWSIPWPIFVSLPFVLIFSIAFSGISPLCPFLIIAGYVTSLVVRYSYWSKLPPDQRHNFFGPQTYGGTFSSGGFGGGFGGGGFGGGGGGCGGGGGAGGGF